MANSGYVLGKLRGLPDNVKNALTDIFTYVLPDIRVGLPGHQKKAENLAWIQLDGVTSTTANQEFSIAHGLAMPPRVLFPCLDLTSSGTQMVPMVCSRAADARRVYLRSATASAAFTIFVESR